MPESGHRIRTGELPHGRRNSIADVSGVTVGHATVDRGDVHTGVTVVVPCEGPVIARRPVAAAHVLNGFGKTCGLVQVGELGCIETPIALTNTLCVGRVADGLVTNALREARSAGLPLPSTINPVVGETNDGRVSDIRARAVGESDVLAAIDSASADFARGSVGAGRGTVCFGLKGGIGSSSRLIEIGGATYTLGVLVQSNFGRMPDLAV
ncbi:MAG: P1 family peptidase, partial [Olsenella sp.]|nr:P1 family peptidase [Olsenella sp.]